MNEPSKLTEAPTSERYTQALGAVENVIRRTERALLSVLYSAPQAMTSYDLAEHVFPSEGRHANKKIDERFKSLGKLIRKAIPEKERWNIEPVIPNNPKAYWSTVAVCYDGELCRYELLPEVREALELLGWEKRAIPAPSLQQLASLQRERETRLQEILVRRGQATFRDRLIAAYGNKCAVTGCDADQALEAAHIAPYSESLSDCPTNGLLLRADIHTLFDLYLLGIDPQTQTVSLSPTLLTTTYRKLHGRKIIVPSDPALQPSEAGLAARWSVFNAGP